MSRTTTTSTTHRLLKAFADDMDRDAPLNHILAFARVALAGDAGVDQATVQNELKLSSAGISRTMQALSAVSYQKDREGYGLVEITFGDKDRRARILKLTSKGEKLVAKLGDILAKGTK